MRKMKRFRQAYLDVCFIQTGMYQRRVNPILRMFNHGGYTVRY